MSATGTEVVDVVHGDGFGGFTCEQKITVDGATTVPALLAVGDVNGDTLPDVVVMAAGMAVVLRQP